jgi:hypothetical protein
VKLTLLYDDLSLPRVLAPVRFDASLIFFSLNFYALCSYWGVQNRAEKLMMNGIRQV